jgi:hypothetical protein
MSRRRKILIAILAMLGVTILIPVIHHYQLRFAVEKYIAELKAKGEPLELAQVIPPPVPPDKNGVPFITNALATLKSKSVTASNTPPAMRMVAPGKAIIGWQQSNIIGFDATNTWKDLGQELAAVKSELDSFQNLSTHPILDFNLDYKKGFDLRIDHLASLKRSAQWLSASVLYNLHQGNTKDACAGAREMIAVIQGETEERLLISQLVRIAISTIGANVTWEILQKPDVADDDLAQLQQDWQSLDFVKSFEQSLIFERAQDLQEFAQTRTSTEKFNNFWRYFYATDALKPDISQFEIPKRRSLFLRKWDELRWRWFWSYRDELYGLQSLQVVIDAILITKTNNFQAAQSFTGTNLTSLNVKRNSVNAMNGLRDAFSGNAFNAALRKTTRIKTAQTIIVSAIALKRYQLKHGNYPADLNSLVPEFISAVPLDPVDGKPLRYKLNSDGTFLLYSVGENGVDDGGNPSLEKGVESSSYYWQNPHALDWVWPQPATAAEIQKYYDERGKKAD